MQFVLLNAIINITTYAKHLNKCPLPVTSGNLDSCEEGLVTLKVLNQRSVIAVNNLRVFLLLPEVLQYFLYTVAPIQYRLSCHRAECLLSFA